MSSSRLTGCYVLLTLVTVLSSKSRAQSQIQEDDIQVSRGNRTLLFGQELTIPCRYLGTVSELSRLEWLHNGDMYSQSGSPTSTDQFIHVLIVEDISFSDSGEYSCRAILTNGDTRGPVSAGFIEVLDTSIINAPPRQYVLEGDDITLQCSADHPNFFVDWDPDPPLVTDASIEAELNGEYMHTCRVFFNGGAINSNQAIEAIVIVPPRIISHSQTTIHYTSSSTPVSLSACFRSRTRDTTTITWERVGGVLPSNIINDTSIDNYGNGTTSLQFISPSHADSGTYRVIVSNSHSVIPEGQRTVSVDLELRVKTLPALPSDLSAQPINQTHSRISWKLNHKTQEEAASYLYLNLLQPMNKTFNVPLGTDEEFILEVEPGNDYLISLTARNDDGRVTTNSTSFTTAPDNPRIRSVKVQRLNSTSLAVAVVLNFTGGGDITSITLTHEGLPLALDLDSPPQELESRKWGGVVSNRRLDSFLPYTDDVQFSVTVTNERNLSTPVSANQTFIAPGSPTQPTILSTTDSSFKVQSQLSSMGTEPLTKIIMVIMDSKGRVTTENITGEFSREEVVEINAEGLSPETQYTVKVRGVNAGGEGSDSDPMTINTERADQPIPHEALIGIVVGGCVVVTILLILVIIFSIYCIKFLRSRSGRKYCTSDSKDKSDIVGDGEMGNKTIANFINGYPSREEGALTPRSPLTSRASSTLPPGGTDYSYEDSEIDHDSVFHHAPLHKKQLDNVHFYNHSHYQYRHSPAPSPLTIPLKAELFSSSTSIPGIDQDLASPPATALSYATDV